MKIEVNSGNAGSSITFTGPMTYEHSREMENQIINAMRRHPRLDVDLSSVDEIDLCGIHLLCMLKSYGGDAVHIVATSPTVENALQKLPVASRHSRRRRVVPKSPREAMLDQAAA